MRVLIADNESILRFDLREMLSEAGHDVVVEASDGIMAIEEAQRVKPDLIIMDICMPRLDGLSAAAKIAELEIAPVILLTAYSDAKMIKDAANCGVMGYLVKPLAEKSLFPAMEIACERYAVQKALKDEVGKLKDDLAAQKLISRAKGIIGSIYHIDEMEAYRRLQKYSMKTGKSLKKVAMEIINSAPKT